MCEQAEAWSKEYGVNYIQMDGQGNPAIEVSNIESLIAKKVDAIVISSHGGVALTPALIQAAEQKIPVILIDGGKPFEDWEFVTWMSTDDEEMGILTAELIAKDLKGKGKVALLEGTSGSSCTEGRAIGYDRYMAQFPDIKTVARQDANWLRKNAIDILTNVLQANPDLSAVYGHNDEITLGAIEAIEAAGKKPGVDILVYSAGDYQTSGLEAIKAGKLRSTMAYHNDGDWAMEAAVAYLMGKPVPKFINLGTSMATIDNVDTQTPAY
jgi:ribose transport system substrate-binding protein